MNRTQLLSSVLVLSGMLFVAPVGSAQTRGFGVVSGEVKSEGGEQVAGVSVKFMLGSGEPLSALVAKDGRWRAVTPTARPTSTSSWRRPATPRKCSTCWSNKRPPARI